MRHNITKLHRYWVYWSNSQTFPFPNLNVFILHALLINQPLVYATTLYSIYTFIVINQLIIAVILKYTEAQIMFLQRSINSQALTSNFIKIPQKIKLLSLILITIINKRPATKKNNTKLAYTIINFKGDEAQCFSVATFLCDHISNQTFGFFFFCYRHRLTHD